MSSWEKIRNLTLGELWVLAQALVLLPLTVLGLRLSGFKGMSPAARRLPDIDAGDREALSRALPIARMVRAAAVHGPCKAACLPQSIVLWRLLRRNGVDSDLRFGVRTGAGQLEAHAWVEVAGVALNETPGVADRFSPLKKYL